MSESYAKQLQTVRNLVDNDVSMVVLRESMRALFGDNWGKLDTEIQEQETQEQETKEQQEAETPSLNLNMTNDEVMKSILETMDFYDDKNLSENLVQDAIYSGKLNPDEVLKELTKN